MTMDVVLLTINSAMLVCVVILTILHARFLSRELKQIEGIASATFLETRKVEDVVEDVQ